MSIESVALYTRITHCCENGQRIIPPKSAKDPGSHKDSERGRDDGKTVKCEHYRIEVRNWPYSALHIA